MNGRDERERPFIQPLSYPLLRPSVGNPDHVADFRAMLNVDPIQATKYRQPPDRAPLLLLRVVQKTKHVVLATVAGCFPKDFKRAAPVVAGADYHDPFSVAHWTALPSP